MNSQRVAELFAIANQNLDAPERSRRIAVNQLLDEFRLQAQRLGRSEATRIDPLLVQGIKDWGFRIFLNTNPVMALETLLGAREKRGKRAKNTERDFRIAIAVFGKMRLGLSLERAAEAVAADYGLEPDSIIKIWKRNKIEAKAHVAMAKFEASAKETPI